MERPTETKSKRTIAGIKLIVIFFAIFFVFLDIVLLILIIEHHRTDARNAALETLA